MLLKKKNHSRVYSNFTFGALHNSAFNQVGIAKNKHLLQAWSDFFIVDTLFDVSDLPYEENLLVSLVMFHLLWLISSVWFHVLASILTAYSKALVFWQQNLSHLCKFKSWPLTQQSKLNGILDTCNVTFPAGTNCTRNPFLFPFQLFECLITTSQFSDLSLSLAVALVT